MGVSVTDCVAVTMPVAGSVAGPVAVGVGVLVLVAVAVEVFVAVAVLVAVGVEVRFGLSKPAIQVSMGVSGSLGTTSFLDESSDCVAERSLTCACAMKGIVRATMSDKTASMSFCVAVFDELLFICPLLSFETPQ